MTTLTDVTARQGDGDPGEALVAGWNPEWTTDQLDALIRSTPGHVVDDAFPLVHRFAPGVYAREITMPAGFVILGKQHRTTHFNIISKGTVSFWMQGEPVRKVSAPYTFVSGPGIRKVLYIHEETVWTTIHVTDETDPEKLEALLIAPHENPLLIEGAPV